MKAPLTFAWRNVLFGRNARDAWAIYRLATQSYAGLTAQAKRDVLSAVAGFAFTIAADFQLLRVSRSWPVERYRDGAWAGADNDNLHAQALGRCLAAHERHLRGEPVRAPEVFIAVRLGSGAHLTTSPRAWLSCAATAIGLDDARGISRRELDELLAQERRVFACVSDFLDCDRASTIELQWLIRRAFFRGVSEPDVDPFWQPPAMVVDIDDEAGGRFVPLDGEMLRLCDVPLSIGSRSVKASTELGDSHQAFLMLGALPEVVAFPGRQAELLFAPLEAVPFPVDAVVSAQWIANGDAVALARRKIVDADNIFTEEAHGDHGPTASAALRPSTARDLEDYLTGPDRPPLLRASIGLCVSASAAEDLEERVQRLRREYAPVQLHRPLGSQLELFLAHLPGQASRVRHYDDILLCEQLGAMVPTATHAVGSASGMYIGRALSGAGQPVLFDITEAPRTSRPGAILCSGTLGSGKTMTAQLLAYQAFLLGSRIVTVDPKGDHRLHELVGSAHVEIVELQPSERDRGRLDPLRIAPPETRADLAYSFLIDLLPAPVPPGWQTEIRDAVNVATAAGGESCGDVLAILDAGNEHAREAGRALAVHASSGLLQLAFADAGVEGERAGARQVTCLRIANLTLPLPGTPRADLTADERAGQALLRLLAAYALHLMGSDWARHKVLVLDEAWMLLGDATGRALVQRINRLCRSQNATPILATQALADIEELENLIGAYFCFGVETDAEAQRALSLLHMDSDDERLRTQLQSFRRGRCFMRDYEGRVSPVQIDLVDEQLVTQLDTTPRKRRAAV